MGSGAETQPQLPAFYTFVKTIVELPLLRPIRRFRANFSVVDIGMADAYLAHQPIA